MRILLIAMIVGQFCNSAICKGQTGDLNHSTLSGSQRTNVASLEPIEESDIQPALNTAQLSISELVQHLGHADYRHREAATNQLARMGSSALREVAYAALDSDPEIRFRASKLLNEIALNGDLTTLQKSTRLMHLLSQHGHPSMLGTAQTLHERWRETQTEKMIDKLKSFGADTFGVDVADRQAWALRAEAIRVRPAIRGEFRILVEDSAVESSLNQSEPSDTELPNVENESGQNAKVEQVKIVDVELAISEIVNATELDDESALADIEVATSQPVMTENMQMDFMDSALVDPFAVQGIQSQTRTVRLTEKFEFSEESLKLLRQVNRLNSVVIESVDPSKKVVHVDKMVWDALERMPDLRYIRLEKTRFDADEGREFKKQRPNVTIELVNRAALGVQGPTAGSDGPSKISVVMEDTPAEKAGIQVDDVIVEIDGHQIESFQSLVFEIGSHVPGDELNVKIDREGELLELKVTLGGSEILNQ